MKNALRAALVVLMGIGSVGCCCHGSNNGCNDCCDGGCGGGGCGRSFWLWRPFCCAGCGQQSHLDWWQNPPPCCNACNQCGQWHGQQYGSGPGGGYYSQDGNMPAGAVMDDGGDIVDDNGPPQPTPAASQRPVRRTSYVRRPPMQYQNSQPGQHQPQQGQYQQQQGQYSQRGQYPQQSQGQNAPQYYQ